MENAQDLTLEIETAAIDEMSLAVCRDLLTAVVAVAVDDLLQNSPTGHRGTCGKGTAIFWCKCRTSALDFLLADDGALACVDMIGDLDPVTFLSALLTKVQDRNAGGGYRGRYRKANS